MRYVGLRFATSNPRKPACATECNVISYLNEASLPTTGAGVRGMFAIAAFTAAGAGDADTCVLEVEPPQRPGPVLRLTIRKDNFKVIRAQKIA